MMRYRFVSADTVGRSYKDIKDECLLKRKLFEDPDFPANARSLYFKGDSSPDVVWKRPAEVVRNPVFINNLATHYDIDQGDLGDCWFMAAAATVACCNKKLLARVVPMDQNFNSAGYAGIFRFNFWQYDKWEEVIVDDRLPTYRGRDLIYAKNREEPNEFWSALLEKAYAKLFGCYQALDGGRVHDALVDMTGGVSELMDLSNKSLDPDTIFTLLTRTYSMNSLIGGAIFKTVAAPREVRQDTGLYQGHAYSITKFATISKSNNTVEKLVRVRNPWGRGEWNGAWSDSSREWNKLTREDKRKLGLVIENDGEFWMSIADLLLHFDELELTHLTPDALTAEVAEDTSKKEWEVAIMRDSWVRGVSAGGCGNSPYESLYWKNPQYRLTLDPKVNGSTVVVSLMEVQYDRGRNVSIGFDIYELKTGIREPLVGENISRSALILRKSSGLYSPYREKTVRFELDPGKYVIIPSTFKPFEESEFLLRFYAEMKTESEPVDVENGPIEDNSTEEEDIIPGLFNRIVGRAGFADPLDLREILAEAKKKEWRQSDGFALETCRSLLTAMDVKSKRGMIDQSSVQKIWENLNLWKDAFRAFDKNKSGSIDTYELRDVYKLIGVPDSIGIFQMSADKPLVQFDSVQSLGLNVSRHVLKSIVRRYGGRQGLMGLEDFVLSSSRLIVMYRAFTEHAGDATSKANISLDEWLETTMYS